MQRTKNSPSGGGGERAWRRRSVKPSGSNDDTSDLFLLDIGAAGELPSIDNSANQHLHSSHNPQSRPSADKPLPFQGKDHAQQLSNGFPPMMNGSLPNGAPAMPPIPNRRPVQPAGHDKATPQTDGSGSVDKGPHPDLDSPHKSSESRGNSGELLTRDDGYFASAPSSNIQEGCRTTHVKLDTVNTSNSSKDSRKDPLVPTKNDSEIISTARTRDFQQTANSTDDIVTTSGRFSPNTPTRRRGSMSLARRATRSINSDMHLDEVPQDEDAARWAEHIRQKRASKRKRKEDEDDDRVVVGTKVDQNHVNWVTAYNMLTGIRFVVSRTNAKMDRELTDADFEAKHKFSFDITGNELTPSAKYDFKFKDYAPWVFRRLRTIFRLDPADYLVSLTSKYILSELGSPGKSGSFFYFSRDYKYIIKTIHHAEHKFLRKILKEYYNHVQENPNTLLSQFYGLHRVKMPFGRKIHFVVMNNLFPPHRDIHRTFDLKGSTIGRDFKEEELEKNPRATLKDLNWLRRNLHLEFGPTKKKAFIEQMQRDVKLLQRLKIMDYSLLVGIHDLERGNEENLRDKTLQVFQPGGDDTSDVGPNMLARTPSKLENARKAKELRHMIKTQKPVPMDQTASKMPDELQDPKRNFYFYADDGGFRATHEDNSVGEEIYYLGIIDCLTHYSLIKRMEHFIKGLSNQESQISAIPPERYGDRFIKFISSVTKTREAVEREKNEEGTNSIDGPLLTGVNMTHRDRESTEKVMEKAEHQAERSWRRGSSEEDVPDRAVRAVRSPSAERGEPGGATLPVVEEVVESSSTGARSGRSTETDLQLPAPPLKEGDVRALQGRSRNRSHHRPPPTPPKDSAPGNEDERPPILPKNVAYSNRHSGPPTPPKEEKGRGRDKELPLPPPMETVVRVN
ncbi:SAICAR synthase-like protein [Lojkania enalia]|uniref:1-phosphatidylinositol-4-phosphate 5-kinase n=1 Tax=Lojkania enalia TaxID=147567 RepID=A0A9P4KH52_9PLEO|nr:SAICAR synthase-like protein [Didymosphaeria enalia]